MFGQSAVGEVEMVGRTKEEHTFAECDLAFSKFAVEKWSVRL